MPFSDIFSTSISLPLASTVLVTVTTFLYSFFFSSARFVSYSSIINIAFLISPSHVGSIITFLVLRTSYFGWFLVKTSFSFFTTLEPIGINSPVCIIAFACSFDIEPSSIFFFNSCILCSGVAYTVS